jgi:hypothetical protein
MDANTTRAEALEAFGPNYSEGDEIKLTLPRVFFEDHVDRDLPHGYVIKITRYTVDAMMTRNEITELLSDADYYSDSGIARDMGMPSLAQSAKRTIAAIGRYVNVKNVYNPRSGLSTWRIVDSEVAA